MRGRAVGTDLPALYGNIQFKLGDGFRHGQGWLSSLLQSTVPRVSAVTHSWPRGAGKRARAEMARGRRQELTRPRESL